MVSKERARKMKIKETIWLWGQDQMSHHRVGSNGENIWNLPGVNKMDPVQGALFFRNPKHLPRRHEWKTASTFRN